MCGPRKHNGQPFCGGWGSGIPWHWRPGCLFVVPHCLVAPTRRQHHRLDHHSCDPPDGTLCSDVVWTRTDAMASLQAPGARCLLWVGPRLFFLIQARDESSDLYCPFQRPFRDVDEHKPPASQESCQCPVLINFLIFSFIREDLNTHPSLTNAVSISFPSLAVSV